MGKNIYFTPGPSQLYHTVPFHINNALKEDVMSISHRSSAFKKIVEQTLVNLNQLLDLDENYKIVFTSSANEIWERILQNFVVQSSHHFINGSFSQKFYDFTKDYNLDSSHTTKDYGLGFDSLEVPESAELVAITLNETSTGFNFPSADITKIRNSNPNVLIAADVVSAIPSIPINYNELDIIYFSVQKCFGLPAGLGVFIFNQKAIEQFKNKKNSHITGSYHSLDKLLKQIDNFQTPETPNMLAIYLLGKVCEDFSRRGLKIIQSETSYKAALLYSAYERLNYLEPFIKTKEHRSKTVCIAETKNNAEILSFFKKKGLILGTGYGSFKESHIRIANFPAHSKENIELIVDLLDSY